MQHPDSTQETTVFASTEHRHAGAGALAHLVTHWRRWRERRAMIKVLAALSDRMLQDAGISRADIARVADAAVRDKPWRK